MLSRVGLIIPIVVLLTVGCNTSEFNSDKGQCSVLTETADGLSIQNSYFKYLVDGTVVSIIQNERIGDSLNLPTTSITPVYPKAESAKWTINFEAQDFKISKDLLISEVQVNGKDASYKIFNLKNGNEVISYTYDKFDVLFVDENEKRFLGLYGMNASDKASSGLKFEELTFGFLNYSNKEGKLGQIRIDAKDPLLMETLDVSNPVIELLPLRGNSLALNSGKTLYFTGADGKRKEDVNFDVKITFYTTDTYEELTILLQVRNDKIELAENFSNTVFHLESL